MGKVDISAKDYISNNEIFADLYNYYLFAGKQVIHAKDLDETDPDEIGMLYGEDKFVQPVQRFRDVLKRCVIKKTEFASLIILGIENQTEIHYAMPVRNMVYDALNYASQITEITKTHKRKKDFISSEEFLSGLKKDEFLKPVITLVLYLGQKEWDAPRNLYEMLDIRNPYILHFMSNYEINLIVPKEITDFQKFHTNIRYVLEFIKASGSRDEIKTLIEREKEVFSKLDFDTASFIAICTSINIKRDRRESTINMCKAWEDQKEEGERLFIVLTQRLIEDSRIDDLKRATEDGEYRSKLYREYKIE